MKCEICGTEYKDSDRFCGMCGTPNPLLEIKSAPTESRPEPYGADSGAMAETAPSDTENVNSNTEIADDQSTNEAPEYQNTSDASGTADTPDTSDAFDASEGIFPDPTKSAAAEKSFDNISAAFYGNDENDKADYDVNSPQKSEAYEKTENAEEPSPSIVPKDEETDGTDDDIQRGNTNIPEAEKTTEAQGGAYAETHSVPIMQNTNAPAKAQKPQKPQKEKRVCSLSAVIVCIVIILILSVICGVLGGLYTGEKARVRKLSEGRNGSITAPYSYSEFFDKK